MKITRFFVVLLLALSLCLSLASCKKDKASDNSNTNESENENKVNIPDPLTYEEYQALSTEGRKAYYDQFTNYEDFFAWYNAAVEKYKQENPGIDFDGEIELDFGNSFDDAE